MITPHLRVFVTVAEKKNFSRAAEALSLTQPAISQQIHTLEEFYGTKLFERTSKRVELTRAGETLLPYAMQILDLGAVAKDAVDELTGTVSGRLTIGASFTIGEYLLPALIAEYTREYPTVELAMLIGNTEEIGEKLLDLSVDVAVVEGRLVHRHLQLTPMAEDELVLIASPTHPLAAKREVNAAQLHGELFILREEGSGTRMVAEEALLSIGVTPKRVISLGSTQAIKETIEAGLGLALLSKWCVRKEVRNGTLSALSVTGIASKRPLSMVEHTARIRTRAVEAFVELLKRRMK